MSLIRPTAARAAAALATGALALGLAAVPASATTTPHDVTADRAEQSAPAPRAAAEVEGGATTFAMDRALVERLLAHGVEFAHVDAVGELRRAASDAEAADTNFTLGIRSGRMAADADRVTGRINYSKAGLALINRESDRTVVLAGFEADLDRGVLRARMNEEAKSDLGRFERPAADTATLNARDRVLAADSEVRLTRESARALNEALDTNLFRAGRVLFDTRSTVTFDAESDLRAAFPARVG